jgi:hypothetical protein
MAMRYVRGHAPRGENAWIGGLDVDPPLESSAEEAARGCDSLNDLRGISAFLP